MHEGVDICWAAFNVIELMASPKLQTKRIAYILASLIFQDISENDKQLLDLKTLTPNIFRKDLQNTADIAFYTTSISINCISKLCTEDIASILYPEILPLFNCSKPVIRKKICILAHRLVFSYPECCATIVPYLADRLKDPSPAV